MRRAGGLLLRLLGELLRLRGGDRLGALIGSLLRFGDGLRAARLDDLDLEDASDERLELPDEALFDFHIGLSSRPLPLRDRLLLFSLEDDRELRELLEPSS